MRGVNNNKKIWIKTITKNYKEPKDSGRGVAYVRVTEEEVRVTTPAPARLVIMDAIESHSLSFGSYISAELRYVFPS